jgi:hypothetical protein
MKAVFTIGVPGSGKSQWCKKYTDETGSLRISRDELRVSLTNISSEEFHRKEKFYRNEIERIINILVDKICDEKLADLVFDGTNLNTKALYSTASKLSLDGWDVTFVMFPYVKQLGRLERDLIMHSMYNNFFDVANLKKLEEFVDIYGIEIITISKEQQHELLHNDLEGRK